MTKIPKHSVNVISAGGDRMTIEYRALTRTTDSRTHYGIAVTSRLSDGRGDRSEIRDITTIPAYIEKILRTLVRGTVTPTSLYDVVEDLLAEM
ncbi:MAG: DUF6514 family protein [Oscillospiraceae bacterium]|jgi:hypothetical protein|nr:DUF6514 family protein [Oscillospiraceae bacterium]